MNYSVAGFQLVLSRKSSFYVVTYYLPSGLFVVVSWISFLINPEVTNCTNNLTSIWIMMSHKKNLCINQFTKKICFIWDIIFELRFYNKVNEKFYYLVLRPLDVLILNVFCCQLVEYICSLLYTIVLFILKSVCGKNFIKAIFLFLLILYFYRHKE